MKYIALLALLLGACALEPYVAPDGSVWPSRAAYEATIVIELPCEWIETDNRWMCELSEGEE